MITSAAAEEVATGYGFRLLNSEIGNDLNMEYKKEACLMIVFVSLTRR